MAGTLCSVEIARLASEKGRSEEMALDVSDAMAGAWAADRAAGADAGLDPLPARVETDRAIAAPMAAAATRTQGGRRPKVRPGSCSAVVEELIGCLLSGAGPLWAALMVEP